mmetsp:Transcript_43491/g.105037  ORF Transcript_43491/g.105037 Transcript_43491/m.105037 type:complete len:166 (-) Transcript_43491:2465-2962(-)
MGLASNRRGSGVKAMKPMGRTKPSSQRSKKLCKGLPRKQMKLESVEDYQQIEDCFTVAHLEERINHFMKFRTSAMLTGCKAVPMFIWAAVEALLEGLQTTKGSIVATQPEQQQAWTPLAPRPPNKVERQQVLIPLAPRPHNNTLPPMNPSVGMWMQQRHWATSMN